MSWNEACGSARRRNPQLFRSLNARLFGHHDGWLPNGFRSASPQTPYDDGMWNVTIQTRAGSCDPTTHYAVTVADGKVSGPANVSGTVSRSGNVRVSIGAALPTDSSKVAQARVSGMVLRAASPAAVGADGIDPIEARKNQEMAIALDCPLSGLRQGIHQGTSPAGRAPNTAIHGLDARDLGLPDHRQIAGRGHHHGLASDSPARQTDRDTPRRPTDGHHSLVKRGTFWSA